MTPQQIDAMKQALEALEDRSSLMKWQKARDAINEALAEHAMRETQRLGQEIEQEPVATDWNAVHKKLELVWYRELSADEGLDEIQDLINTTPPQRKPLSAEQVSEICAEWTDENGNTGSFGRRQIARAIEAAHGIKGGA